MKIVEDLRLGLRSLIRNPSYSAVALLILTLSIGATTAIFTVVDTVLLKPLPFPDSERLVKLWETRVSEGTLRNVVSDPNFVDWREQNQSFERLAAYFSASVTVTGGELPEQVQVAATTADFFPVLGAEPLAGRFYQSEEERVIVLSQGLWQRRFGSDPAALGKTMVVDGEPMVVIGVAPRTLRFPEGAVLWLPFRLDTAASERSRHRLHVLGKLRPGVSLQRARADLDTIAARLERQYPESNTGWGINAVPLREEIVGAIRPSLTVLSVAVGLVLLIACVNLASLLLSRAAEKSSQTAVQVALGAHRGQVIRRFLTESLLLSVISGALGVWLARAAIKLLVSLRPGDLPRVEEIHVDLRVLAFALLVSVATGLLFSLYPALRASRPDLVSSLKEGGRAAVGVGGRLQSLLVVPQLAIALVLLICAGLLIRTFWTLTTLDPGFDPNRLLTGIVTLPDARYPEPHQKRAFFDALLDRLEGLPGVRSVAAVSDLPVLGIPDFMNNAFDIVGQPPRQPGDEIWAYLRWVSPGYFQTMKIPLLRGRTFEPSDNEQASYMTVVDQAFVDQYFPHEDPLGKRIIIYSDPNPTAEIIGVVGNVRPTALDQPPEPHTYVSYRQIPVFYMSLVIRTEVGPEQLAPAVRKEVFALDRELPVQNLVSMDERLQSSISQRRFNMLVLGLFALVALVLATVGIYAVTSNWVSRRTREIGIRMALGAVRSSVVRMIVGQSAVLILSGTVIGLILAFFVTRLLAGLLYGVAPIDLVTWITLAVALGGVALMASYLPALRASGFDPVTALRYE
jgi:putative ABC transport system permease protein